MAMMSTNRLLLSHRGGCHPTDGFCSGCRLLGVAKPDADSDEHEGDPTDGTPHVDRCELHNGLQLELKEEEEVPAPVSVQVSTWVEAEGQ